MPVQILTSGPDSQWAAIRQLYAFMIVSAQRHVFLQSPFFIPDATIAEALRAAALSGIDVKVMLSARPSGNRLPDWAGNTYIADIVDAGVRVFLYEKGYLHAKTISIDSEICSIGSANIDIRSFSINYETQCGALQRAARQGAGGGFRARPRPLHRIRPGGVSEAQRRRPVQGFGREAPLAVAVIRNAGCKAVGLSTLSSVMRWTSPVSGTAVPHDG